MRLTVDQRINLNTDYESGLFSITELARRYGVSYPKAHKWIKRYKTAGWDGLKNKSRDCWHHPLATKADVWSQVRELKESNPSWGALTLKRKLLELNGSAPAQSTISEFLRKNALRVPPQTQPDKKVDALVNEHLNIARHCVALWSWDDYADAWSAAMRALLNAAETFDAKRGMTFKSYAFKIVKLRLLDYQRTLWDVRRKTARPVLVSLEMLGSTRGGRNDEQDESMAVDIEDTNVELPWASMERKESLSWLDGALKKLDRKRRAILMEFYRSGGNSQTNGHSTLEKLGSNYGVSGSRISQICTESVNRLREMAIAA